MTAPHAPHLTPDEIDAALADALDPAPARHLVECAECFDVVRSAREVATRMAALPLFSPSLDFADRVMASVVMPDPFSLRAIAGLRHRIGASRRSMAWAAGIAAMLLLSMSASAAWTLTHQETLAQIGSSAVGTGWSLLWTGLRGLVSNLIEQPWYAQVRTLFASAPRAAMITAGITAAYFGGVLVMRRLLAIPSQRVADVIG